MRVLIPLELNESSTAAIDIAERLLAEGTPPQDVTASTSQVIVLVHGIRDYALWQENIRAKLQESGFKVEPTNFGRYDLLRFLAPFPWFSNKAIQKILHQIQIVQQIHPGSSISVIAHSFGTYVIAKILQRNFNVELNRVIFCGSVVNYEFPFELFKGRFSAPILNEVGTRDIWPAMAESVTWGYGSAGTYGFRRPLVFDRWHNGAHHGYFLEPGFCERFWVPFLTDGKIVPGDKDPERPRSWIQLLSVIRIKYVVLLVLAALVYSVAFAQ